MSSEENSQTGFKSKLDLILNELNQNLPKVCFDDSNNENPDELEKSEFKYEFEYEDEDEEEEFLMKEGGQGEEKKTIEKSKTARKNETSESFRIANTMFTNTRLSTTTFDSIDLDEALKTMNSQNMKLGTSPPSKTNVSRRSLSNNDDKVMRKLADMSNGWANSQAANKPAPKMKVEGLNSHEADYRREPKGVDGNLVQTRRIDLRPSQVAINPTNADNSEPSLESLLRRVLNSIESNQKKTLSSSSSSSESDEDENDLWIERYRRQKLLQKKESC